MNPQGPIFLIGTMCSGKTTLAEAVAARTGLPSVDTDTEIERRAGMSVGRIFEIRGEEGFRALERRVIEDLCDKSAGIIATGGGVPCDPGNMDRMLRGGTVVWLRCDMPVLLRRMAEGAEKRPLLAGLDAEALRRNAIDIEAARAPFYGRAHSVFDSTRLDTPAEIEDTVRKFISTYLNERQ